MNTNAELSRSMQSSVKQRKRRTVLIYITLLLVIIAVLWACYWFIFLSHYEETDDAYVAGNQVQIMAQVSGSVNKVIFDNTDFVRKGDVLVTLDQTDAQLACEKMQTTLALTVRQTIQQMINSRQYEANIDIYKTALTQARNNLNRRIPLEASHLIGREELQHARDAVLTAKAQLDVAIQQYNANRAILLNSSLTQQPAVQKAAAELRNAWLTLQRTHIVSPVDGYISRRTVHVGTRITPATLLMVVVPSTDLWVDANFKETQLANIRIGQPATVISDVYGKKVVYHGTVSGLNMGTGSAFSLLPAQNATGNWIKVVQRLPVRIELIRDELLKNPLRIGLSTKVSIDTTNSEGAALASQVRKTPAYSSDALKVDMTPIDTLISQIIQTNTQ